MLSSRHLPSATAVGGPEYFGGVLRIGNSGLKRLLGI
jgi:hypothetical protein